MKMISSTFMVIFLFATKTAAGSTSLTKENDDTAVDGITTPPQLVTSTVTHGRPLARKGGVAMAASLDGPRVAGVAGVDRRHFPGYGTGLLGERLREEKMFGPGGGCITQEECMKKKVICFKVCVANYADIPPPSCTIKCVKCIPTC